MNAGRPALPNSVSTNSGSRPIRRRLPAMAVTRQSPRKRGRHLLMPSLNGNAVAGRAPPRRGVRRHSRVSRARSLFPVRSSRILGTDRFRQRRRQDDGNELSGAAGDRFLALPRRRFRLQHEDFCQYGRALHARASPSSFIFLKILVCGSSRNSNLEESGGRAGVCGSLNV
jgi:hypothetical protein